jgi:pyruvate dehydrogenase (quinone)
MAAGYAKATGRVGVCLATSGPGGIHLLTGLYDAKLDHAPVLAITGMQETTVLGTGHQQEVHLDRLYMDLAEYNVMITTPTSIPALVDRAMRTCLGHRTVSRLSFPNDLQVAAANAEPWPSVGPARTPATAATASSSCRATWPPWLPDCSVRWPRNGPTRAASASPSSATAAWPC